MTSAVEKWLQDNRDTSSDYAELVERMRSGETVECVIEGESSSKVVNAIFMSSSATKLFRIANEEHGFSVAISDEKAFIKFCADSNIIFPKQDFLEKTRKMLEIAANAAQFKAIVLPLNAREDVQALLAIMDRVNE